MGVCCAKINRSPVSAKQEQVAWFESRLSAWLYRIAVSRGSLSISRRLSIPLTGWIA
jgi:hypothetical protein